jgi:hypothetical protein
MAYRTGKNNCMGRRSYIAVAVDFVNFACFKLFIFIYYKNSIKLFYALFRFHFGSVLRENYQLAQI